MAQIGQNGELVLDGTYQLKTIIPEASLTLTQQTAVRQRAAEAGIRKALELRIRDKESALVARHAEAVADWGSAAALSFWNTTALAAIGTAVSVFPAAANPVLGVNKIAVFYRAVVGTAPIPVSLLRFSQAAAATTMKAVFDLEQLVGQLVPAGYFSEPVVYEPNDTLNITVVPKIATALACNLVLGCYIIEPRGPGVS